MFKTRLYTKCFILLGTVSMLIPGCSDNNDDNIEEMTIQSTAFGSEAAIPTTYACNGKSPPLSFSLPPQETKSLAVIMDSPDHLTGNYTHWLVWGLPPKSVLNEDANKYPTQGMVVGTADNGNAEYVPPCPPEGKTYRYVFTVYALDKTIKLKEDTTRSVLDAAMEGHILAKGSLMGIYTGTD